MVQEKSIVENTQLFMEAIENYRSLSNELITRLAEKLEFPVEEVSEDWRRKLERAQTKGSLDDNWEYWFHGMECQFRNTVTGQVVDVRLKDYRDEHSLPDPYFFAKYIRTTGKETELANLLKGEIQNRI